MGDRASGLVLAPAKGRPMHDAHALQNLASRYFFHVIRNGTGTDHSDGLEFADKAAVWQEAAISCGEIIREVVAGGVEPGCHWLMEVSEDGGRPIFRFTFTAEELG
jgi:Domain of unknown function (DUF6894)